MLALEFGHDEAAGVGLWLSSHLQTLIVQKYSTNQVWIFNANATCWLDASPAASITFTTNYWDHTP